MNGRKSFQNFNINENEIRISLIQCNKKKLSRFSLVNIKNLKNKNGITLIALVISIIVMLILAGVSLNATIGDNGIITQAQNATYMQSVASLEEFLNNYYVEHYDKMNTNESKVEALIGLEQSWFYHPNLNYVVDSDGTAHYFIIPENLPTEISSQIQGGKSTNKEYRDYINCNDVYGVTKDLKVYYCKSGKDTIMGVNSNELEQDSPTRIIFPANSNWSKLISGSSDKEIQAKDIKSVTSIKIDENSGINDLSEIYNIVGLKKLEISNITVNLNGIENLGSLEEISFNNCILTNENVIGKCSNLVNLSLINEKQEIVTNVLDSMKINDLAKLKRLEIYADKNEYVKAITDVSQLADFTEATKKSLTHLNLKYEDIDNLNFLNGYDNLYELDITNNSKITTLNGITSTKLSNLYADSCNLGANETEECNEENALYVLGKCTNLNYIGLRNNIELKHVNYLKNNKRNYSYIYLSGDSKILANEIGEIRLMLLKATSYSCESKYADIINGTEKIDLTRMDLNDDSEKFLALKNNTNLKSLNLRYDTNLSNEKINEILSTCTGIKYLSLEGLSQITNIDFVKNMPDLQVLDLQGCSNLNDISILEELKISNKQDLKTLRLDNGNIDLTKIQNVINNLESYNPIGEYAFGSYWGGYYGFFASYDVWTKLSECENITRIKGSYCNNRMSFGDKSVDLTGCKKLKIISIGYATLNLKIPDSVTNIYLNVDSLKSDFIFSTNSQLEELSLGSGECHWTNAYFSNWCKRLSVCQKLKKITIQDTENTVGSRSSLSKLENIDLLKNCSSLRTLSITSLRNLTDITGIGELTQLTTLSLYNCTSLVDISDLAVKYENGVQKGLTNLTYLNLSNNSINDISCLKDYKNLQELNLNKNRISNIYYLKDLSKLSKLSIQNNCIYDNDYYSDENGNSKTFNSTEILLNLYNQSLKYIYIDNNYIVDFSKISKLKWNEHTGF